MPQCCIVQCSSRKNRNQPQLTFHRMPKNETLRKKWIDIIGIKNINPRHKDLFVCSLHFEESSFNRTLDVVRLHENILPLASTLVNKNSSASKKVSKSPEKCYPQQLQPNKSLPLTSEKLTDKHRSSALCESSNEQQEDIADVIPPLQNVEIAIKKMRNAETIKKLTSTCNQEHKKIKHLNEVVRKKNKEIALLKNVVEDLKKTYNEQTLHIEECPGSQDFRKKLIDKSRGLVHSTMVTGDITWVTTGTL